MTNEIVRCCSCGRIWTGSEGDACPFCRPVEINWFRVVALAALALGGLLLWWVS